MQASAKQNPLDVLVISQLSALRRDEAALQQEVARGDRGNVASDLLQLRDRAERLNRMIDAMGVAGGYWYAPATQNSAA